MIKGILRLFDRPGARILILAWLWYRFRPFSVSGIGMMAIARRVRPLLVRI
jgi:hypothetical protein